MRQFTTWLTWLTWLNFSELPVRQFTPVPLPPRSHWLSELPVRQFTFSQAKFPTTPNF